MNNRRKLAIALGACAFAAPLGLFAQSQGKVWRIGFLGTTSVSDSGSRVEALRAGLRDLGYVEGKNIIIQYRWADSIYERLPELAAELVALKPDVIIAQGAAGTKVAKAVTSTIPIVMGNAGEAVAIGLVASLRRPGGNVTGLTYITPEIGAKRLEMLKETIPSARQIAALGGSGPMAKPQLEAAEQAAKLLELTIVKFDVRNPSEIEGAFAAMAAKGMHAVALLENALLNVRLELLSELAMRYRLPSTGLREFAEAGGLIGYGVNVPEQYRRIGYFVDRILKGAKPADLPVEQPTRFELVVNLKTAKSLGVTIPPTVMVRADRVIQ